MHALLLGEDGFYDDIFRSLRVPYEPVRWVQDIPEGAVDKTARVIELIDAYRTRGHLMADTDPLNYRQRRHPDLDVLSHGLTLWDLDREFAVGGFAGQERMKLRDVLGVLRDSYCRTIGIEYMHISDPEQRAWLQERIEVPHQKPHPAEQKYILSKLNAAEAFETFLQTKYVGQKRFSLEGGETVIPLLDAVLDKAAEHELDEVVIGMPHRGRLNVLANIVGKPISQIFREFEGNLDPGQAHGSGDVKYHLGAEGKYFRMFGDGETVVSLAVQPVATWRRSTRCWRASCAPSRTCSTRATSGYTVLPLMLHGDAAFAGQGVVAETLNLAQLRGYRTGGTVHVVVNNQVGFTTAPEHSRSSHVLHRRREDDRRAGLPRERRRPRGVRLGGQARRRVPRALAQRRRDRHGLLPPPRPQRGRRPVDDPAGDVRRHRRQAQRPQDLHRVADRPRRHLRWRRPSTRCATSPTSSSTCSTRSASWSARRRGPSPSVEEEQLVPPDLDTSVPLEVRPPHRRRARRAARGLHRAPAGQAGAAAAATQMSREGNVDWAFARAARARARC